jgi:hypothetical protein
MRGKVVYYTVFSSTHMRAHTHTHMNAKFAKEVNFLTKQKNNMRGLVT